MPYPPIYVDPTNRVSLGFEKWNRRRVVNSADLFKFYCSCNIASDHPFYLRLQSIALFPYECLFNPSSPFGRAILKLPFPTFISLLTEWFCYDAIFHVVVHQRRILPLLRPKRKPLLKPPSPTPVILSFIPPLYLNTPTPSSPYFPPTQLFQLQLLFIHLLNFVRLSYVPPREGIG